MNETYIRIKKDSIPKSVAGTICGILQDNGNPVVSAIGRDANYNAIISIEIATKTMKRNGQKLNSYITTCKKKLGDTSLRCFQHHISATFIDVTDEASEGEE